MDVTAAGYSSRVQKLETEYQVSVRTLTDEATRAIRALAEISDEDVELLKGIAPSLSVVKTYTMEMIRDNLNGEVDMIHKAAQELSSYLDHRLSFYEEQL